MSNPLLQALLAAAKTGDLDAVDAALDRLDQARGSDWREAVAAEAQRRRDAMAALEERRREVKDQLAAAIQAKDYRLAKRLTGEFKRLYPAVPARPPRRERPRCEAMTRKGTPCQNAAWWEPGEPAPRNGRCRMHGGLSTGPVTPEGKAAIAESNRARARVGVDRI